MHGLMRLTALALIGVLALFADAATVSVDFNAAQGPIKAVNGVGQPPMVGRLHDWPMMRYLKEAGIPYSRLHDVGGWLGEGLFVDIPNLFPNFDADETDPKSYRFAFTDNLLLELEKNGVEPFFRLGVTIENWVEWGLPPQATFPPKDYAKWARVCEHVIRHYTEGWANGFKMKIRYWEIWNEPEGACMWQGSREDYFRLYEVAAGHLKAKFPHLRIGGYASSGEYVVTKSLDYPEKGKKSRAQYLHDWIVSFVENARNRRLPLDFFSFHCYDTPENLMVQIAYLRKLLDDAGYAKTELICNEWHPGFGTGSHRQAAMIAAALCGMQQSALDKAMIYDARCGTGAYSVLFNPATCQPTPAYWAFCEFNELRKLGTAVRTTTDEKGLWAIAAKSGRGDLGVLIVNAAQKPLPLEVKLGGRAVAWCRITDPGHMRAATALPATIPADAVLLVWCQGGK